VLVKMLAVWYNGNSGRLRPQAPRRMNSVSRLRVIQNPNFFDALVHPEGPEHDLPFDLHIFQRGVALNELNVHCYEPVNDLGGQAGAGRLVLGHVTIFCAPLVIALGLNRAPHLHGVPDFNRLGQGANAVQVSQPTRGGVQCVNIKPRIVGDDCDDVHVIAQVGDFVHDLKKGLDDALAFGNVLVILGQLVRVIRGLHALNLAEENLPHDVGTLQDDLASAGANNREADVIGQIVAGSNLVGLDDVASLGVHDDGVILLHTIYFLPALFAAPA